MFITPNFKKSLIVEQFQGNYLNLQLLSNGEIPIKKVSVVAPLSLLKGHKFTVSQVCHHFDNKQY